VDIFGPVYLVLIRGCLYSLSLILFGIPLYLLGDGVSLGEFLIWVFCWNAVIWINVGFEGVFMSDRGVESKHWTTRVYWVSSYLGLAIIFGTLFIGPFFIAGK
jgi:hypothetical protein